MLCSLGQGDLWKVMKLLFCVQFSLISVPREDKSPVLFYCSDSQG